MWTQMITKLGDMVVERLMGQHLLSLLSVLY